MNTKTSTPHKKTTLWREEKRENEVKAKWGHGTPKNEKDGSNLQKIVRP